MDKKLARILTEPGLRLSFVVLLIFACVTAVYSWVVAAVELLVVILVYGLYRRHTKKRSNDIRKYVETLTFQLDDASKHSFVNFPLPMAILRLDTGEVIWYNELFNQITGMHEKMFETHITDAIAGFDTRWLMENKTVCPYEVEIGERKYNVYGNAIRSGGDARSALLATLFWVDITDYAALRVQYDITRPVVALVMIDSYEELFKNTTESKKSILSASIDRQITKWADGAQGILRKLERDRYLFIFENQDLLDFSAQKFEIVESVHEIKNNEGIAATLSIGIGKGDCSLAELYQYADTALDMALSRGGDQVVIKSKTAFEFYGGRTKEFEKRTKVKSRVMANALRQLISESSDVFIMGHHIADFDTIGAAAGVCAAVRKCGRKPYIVVGDKEITSQTLIDKLKQAPEYEDVFINEYEAIVQASATSLLIVVDTSRPDIVEGPQLLQTIPRVVVIDHHRRSASYIENCAVSMHEPYASSACELTAELLQYIITPQDMLRIEAEALLAGIYLDTKGFTVKTGVRTFEAAAYLKQMGADTVEVRKLFSGDLETYVKKYELISLAEQPFPGISVSVTEEQCQRALASQAADELINITDIKASFVVYREGNGTVVSARSYGQLNVQLVLEKIGGGGSMTMAGAQFPDKTPEEVAGLLYGAIREYLDETATVESK